MKHVLLSSALSLCLLPMTAQEWSAIDNMPTGKHHPVTFAVDGFGYAVTGSSAAADVTNDTYKYDPVADDWTSIGDFSGSARSFAIGYAYEGMGYLGFGVTNTNYQRDIWEFDPSSETWSLLTLCPCDARRHPAFMIKDDMIYVGLGNSSVGDLDDWWRYDMNTDTWTELASLPALPRHHPYQFVANDEVYAGFGHGGPIVYDDWYRYDFDNDAWITMGDFPAEARVAGTQFSHNGLGYVLSGDGSDHSFMGSGEMWQYDGEEDTWTEMTAHPGISRWAPGSFVIGDEVYFMGGQNRATQVIESTGYKYSLPAAPDTIDTIPPAGLQDLSITGTLRLYPVPAGNELRFSADFNIERIEIMTLTGRTINVMEGNTDAMDVSGLSSGVYFARVTASNGGQETVRWMKR